MEMFVIRRKERDPRSAGQPAFSIARTAHSANQLEQSIPARKSAATILPTMSVRKHPKLRAKVLAAVMRRQLPLNKRESLN
jgi:hypothetical protein